VKREGRKLWVDSGSRSRWVTATQLNVITKPPPAERRKLAEKANRQLEKAWAMLHKGNSNES